MTRSSTPVKPNFFLIGPPKCATTAIAYQLARHPDIFMSEPKEPHYFCYAGGNPYGWPAHGRDSLEWYERLFNGAGGVKIRGDATPSYICCHHVAAQIHAYSPDAKIVAVLRNPVYRALSAYRYWLSSGLRRISLDDFLDLFPDDKLVNDFEVGRECRVGWLKGVGFYAESLDRYRKLFPSDQMRIMFYDDLIYDYRAFYKELLTFLGVADLSKSLANETRNRTVERRSRLAHRLINGRCARRLFSGLKSVPMLSRVRHTLNRWNETSRSSLANEMSADTYRALIAYYSEDMSKLETMTGRDLSGWRDGTMQ